MYMLRTPARIEKDKNIIIDHVTACQGDLKYSQVTE